MDDKQSEGRKRNGAGPGGKPDGLTSGAEVRETGRRATKSAGPYGPDAGEIGKRFKRTGG